MTDVADHLRKLHPVGRQRPPPPRRVARRAVKRTPLAQRSRSALVRICVAMSLQEYVLIHTAGQSETGEASATATPEFVVTAPVEPSIISSGYLNKKGKNLKGYNRRWFQVRDGFLYYYRKKSVRVGRARVSLLYSLSAG